MTLKLSVCLCVFVCLFFRVLVYGSHSVLINLSKQYGRIKYSSASVVFMIELTKVRKVLREQSLFTSERE